MVISGPNTGGKTVALKTVGLAVLAAQSGIPVAARSARLGIFDRVLADIGDEQSIAADLSTFSAHMLNLKSILRRAHDRIRWCCWTKSARGRRPRKARRWRSRCWRNFARAGCLMLATTHHDRLKAYASTTPGVLNAAVEFDEERLAPTYRLRVGVPGGSSGIAIARRLGLPERIGGTGAEPGHVPRRARPRGLIAYLHRSRDVLEQDAKRFGGENAQVETERRELREEWVGRQRRASRNWSEDSPPRWRSTKPKWRERSRRVKDRELRAQMEKMTKIDRAHGEARSEPRMQRRGGAAFSESQADLGSGVEAVSARRNRGTGRRRAGARARISPAVMLRRRDGASAEVEAGGLADEGAAAEIYCEQRSRQRRARTRRKEAAPPRGVTVQYASVERDPAQWRDQRDWLHGGGGVAARGQISRQRRAGGQRPRSASFMGTALARCAAAWRNFLPAHPLVEKCSRGSSRNAAARR